MAELAIPRRIELVARRQADLQNGMPDYLVYARDRQIGRIYRQLARGQEEQWFWAVQGLFTSTEIGRLHGMASSFDQAKGHVRQAFDMWLEWALKAPPSHKSYATIQKDLRDVGE